ncbi:MAG TPA: iron ABC transporter permease [Candidatus Binatia bacterium]
MSFRKTDLSILLMALMLGVVAFLTVYPLGMIVYGSLRSAAPGAPGFFTLDGYRLAFTDPTIGKALLTTFWLGLARTVISTILAIFFCWVLVRTDMPGKGIMEFFFWVNFFLPILPMTMGWILLLDGSYGLINVAILKIFPFLTHGPFSVHSYGGIIWAHLAYSVSVRVLILAPAFRNMDPALEEAGRMSGFGNLGTLLRITLPLLMPAIVGSTFLGFIKSLESFEVELLLGMPAKIFVYSTKVYDMLRWEPPQYPPAMALSMVFMLFVFGLVFFNRWIITRRHYTTVSGKAFRVAPIHVGPWRWVLLAVCVLYLVVFTLTPFTLLFLGTFMKIAGMFSLPDPYTLEHWKDVLNDPLFFRSLINSLVLGGGAALVGAFFYSLISYLSLRTRLAGRSALDFMTWLPWAVPGLLLSVGLLWVVLGSFGLLVPLYGTLQILIIAVVINQMPVGVRIMDGTMVQIGRELEESARVSGASWLYSFRRVLMPLLSPTFTATAIIIFLSALREISLVVLLYSPKWRVLSILMLEHWIGQSSEKGMVVGLIITLLSLIVAVAAKCMGMKLALAE